MNYRVQDLNWLNSRIDELERTWSKQELKSGLAAAKQSIAELKLENARLRAALEVISRTGEEQNALLRNNKYVFTRFPRSTPPETDAERWEYLAFIMHSNIWETADKAKAALNSE